MEDRWLSKKGLDFGLERMCIITYRAAANRAPVFPAPPDRQAQGEGGYTMKPLPRPTTPSAQRGGGQSTQAAQPNCALAN